MAAKDLEEAFLGMYQRQLALRLQEVEGPTNCLTASAKDLEAALQPLLQACLLAQLPELPDAQRAQMSGEMTPDQRELARAIIELLGSRIDLTEEAGLGPRAFQDLLDKDREVEGFGAAAGQVVRALSQGEALISGTLGALNGQALLCAQERLASLEVQAQRGERDRLLQDFRAAFAKHKEIAAGARPRELLKESERSLAVQQAVAFLLEAGARPRMTSDKE